MDRYPLYLDGAPAGFLTAAACGMYDEYRAVCRPEGPALLRAWLEGERGELPLGVLAPEGDVFTVCRRLSRRGTRELGRLKCCRVRRLDEQPEKNPEKKPEKREDPPAAPAERRETLPPAPPGWEWADRPERLTASAFFAHMLRPLSGVLTRREGGGRLIAAPYDPAEPFPLPPLFCFARIWDAGSGRYAVFAFDERGAPVMPGENGPGAPKT